MTDPRFEVLAGVLAGSHLIGEDAVVSLLAEHAAALGASAVALYLADYDQRHLVPVPGPADGPSPALPIEGTVAGRCYRTLDIQEVGLGDSGRRVWVPLLDGTERLGVFAFDFEAGGGARIEELLVPFASLAAELVMTKRTYGDRFERARRRRPLLRNRSREGAAARAGTCRADRSRRSGRALAQARRGFRRVRADRRALKPGSQSLTPSVVAT